MSLLPSRIALVVAAALLSLLAAATTASADLRIPTLGEATTLSTIPDSTSWGSAIGSDGNTTFVAFSESEAGSCSSASGRPAPSSPPAARCRAGHRLDRRAARSRAPATHVYVAWLQAAYGTREVHAAIATSHDGGRTFSTPVSPAGRPATARGTSRSPPTATTSSSAGATTATACGPPAAATPAARSRARPSSPRRASRPRAAPTTSPSTARACTGSGSATTSTSTPAARPTPAARSAGPARARGQPRRLHRRAQHRRRRRRRGDHDEPAVPDAAPRQDRHRLRPPARPDAPPRTAATRGPSRTSAARRTAASATTARRRTRSTSTASTSTSAGAARADVALATRPTAA